MFIQPDSIIDFVYRYKDYIVGFFLALMILLSWTSGCSRINKKVGLKDDNIIESNLENIIESKLGIKIDLTPENPDEDDYSLDMWRKD